MADLNELRGMLAELKRIRYSGVLRTTYDGKSLEYRSMAELSRAISDLEDEIAGASGKKLPVAGYVSFRRP